ncbi:MAG: pyrroline-5-carboxylate reductase [Syntrophus sp. (in: bacteria)]|nr:pyrroline-5-carboxylate reductase [Syntrophus sp. (in: bacteria)]
MFKSIGFIGGGRVARIILGGFDRKRRWPGKVIVCDINADVLNDLKQRFPKIEAAGEDPKKPAAADVVFLALHPPAIMGMLGELKSTLRRDAVVVSLAPKVSISQISGGLDGFPRIARMIPNAPSVVNKGFNPVAFSAAWPKDEKKKFRRWLNVLGDSPETAEEKLEAYAVITAMGPTCFWFQFYELEELGKTFGMSPKEAKESLAKMLRGALKTMTNSGLSPAEVMDLVPVKPFGEEEANIRDIYRTKLPGLYGRLKG